MKKREIVELLNGLQRIVEGKIKKPCPHCGKLIEDDLKGVKFVYAVAKNINYIKSEIEALKKAIEYSEEFQKYDNERVELAESHSKRDVKGEPLKEPVIQNGQVVGSSFVLENSEKFKKEFEKLKEKYKKVLAAREKQEKDYKELLEEKSNIVLHQIKFVDLPVEITAQQLTGIFAIISEK